MTSQERAYRIRGICEEFEGLPLEMAVEIDGLRQQLKALEDAESQSAELVMQRSAPREIAKRAAQDDDERAAEIIYNLRDALRYRRLRLLGCGPGATEYLARGLVLRFTNLDEFVDEDLRTHTERGDASRAGEPGTQLTASPPGGSDERRTGTAPIGQRARQIDGAARYSALETGPDAARTWFCKHQREHASVIAVALCGCERP